MYSYQVVVCKNLWLRAGEVYHIFDDEDGVAFTCTLGRVDKFNSSKDVWPEYVRCLEHFFAVNDITDSDKQRAVLLTVVGVATYKTLWNLVSPSKPGENAYNELVNALPIKPLQPDPSVSGSKVTRGFERSMNRSLRMSPSYGRSRSTANSIRRW